MFPAKSTSKPTQMTESSNWRAKSFIRISISSKLIKLFAAVMAIYIGRTICESIRKITLIEGAEKGNKNKLGNFSEIFLKLATWSLGGFSNFSLIFFFFEKMASELFSFDSGR